MLADGIWSVPLAFLAFWFIGVVLQLIFGKTVGTYDESFIQPLFLSAAIVIGATNVAIAGMWFTFRGLFKYIYGYKDEQGVFINPSKEDFKKLGPWQKISISLLVFLCFFSAVIVVYRMLV